MKILKLIFAVALLIAFQNCGQNTGPGDSSGDGFSENGSQPGTGSGGNNNTGGTNNGSNLAPIANAGSDQRIIHNGTIGLEQVTLSAAGSMDVDGSIIDYTWYDGGAILALGPTATTILEIGVHRLILTVTDNSGNVASDLVTVTIVGTIPPPPTRPIADFEVTLYPVVRNLCSRCHDTNVVPAFASSSVQKAWDTVINKRLADFNNPGASRIVNKIRGGHQGFGGTEANMIQTAITNWAAGP